MAVIPWSGFDFHFPEMILNGKLLIGLDSYRLNVQQYNFNKNVRAKTPRPQRKTLTYFDEPWRPLRLCARQVFFDLFSIKKFRISLASILK